MKRLFNEHEIRKTADLCGAWLFLKDEKDKGESLGYQKSLPEWETVIVPSVWNNEIGMLNYEGVCWYEKTVKTDSGTYLFEFESVMTAATVYLDGELLGEHYGGFTAFELIARDLEAGEHTLTVKVDSRFDEKSIPQRKVDWFNYGGIARGVTLHKLEGISILSNRIIYTLSDDLKSAEACAKIELYNAENEVISTPVSVKIGDTEIYSGEVTLEGGTLAILDTPPAKIENITLWSVENPYLYDTFTKTSSDDLCDKIGFRLIEAKNGEILLNKEKIELLGVNRHEEHPDWGFAFPPKLMKRDLDIIQTDLGCNTIRGSHYPQSRVFLDMLDARGILFFSEIPIWGGGFPDTVLTDPDVVERGLNMHREMTKQYYNHPSIIIWGMHNEIYTPYPCTYDISKEYSKYLRQNGGNRLISHAAAFPFEDSSLEFDDLISINMYHGWYNGGFSDWDATVNKFRELRKQLKMENKPVIFSEFGCGALYGFHSPFDEVRWSEEYQRDLLDYVLNLFHNDEMVKGFYIWQYCNIRTIHDNLNRVRCYNNKGLVDEYRNPKSAYFKVKELYHKFAKETKK